ncbi:MAG: hypothetical protein O7C62_02260 [Rickettsia endosymbiont of Ixodes persulcatus]|nr:hypothetical protein [Rickettsia endosymbiont of Ixodes persulcatus]
MVKNDEYKQNEQTTMIYENAKMVLTNLSAFINDPQLNINKDIVKLKKAIDLSTDKKIQLPNEVRDVLKSIGDQVSKEYKLGFMKGFTIFGGNKGKNPSGDVQIEVKGNDLITTKKKNLSS